MTRRHPCRDLTRLLDALSEDIIAATDAEVREMHGRHVASTAREVGQLIKAACADKDEGVGAEVGEILREPGAAPRTAGLRRQSHQQRH
ncbi:MAG: hypothetical protein WA418_00800 [Bradyrhizobium sp.]